MPVPVGSGEDLGRQGGMTGTQRICERVCARESRERCLCAFTNELMSLPEEEGVSALRACFT